MRISLDSNAAAMSSSVVLPKQLPVMPLPDAVLFPHALLPLYIFEPRYRNMLEHALYQHRMFCVTLIKPSCPEWRAPEDFFHLATVGLIRACVGRSDGTSNLILQGLQRVRFASFEQETPFPIARIDVVESDGTTTVETEALGAKVLELYTNLKRRCIAVVTSLPVSPKPWRRWMRRAACGSRATRSEGGYRYSSRAYSSIK